MGVRRQEAERHQNMFEDGRDVFTDINLNRSLEEGMDALLAQAGRLFGSQAIAIYRLQGENEDVVTQANPSISGKERASSTMPFGQAVLQQALRTRQPIAIPCTAARLAADEQTEAGRQMWMLPASTAYQALLAVPVVVKHQMYGGVVLYYTEPRRFSQDEMELAVLYSNIAALVMEHVSLREHLQQNCVVAEWNGLTREVYDTVTQVLFSARLIADALPRVLEYHPAEGRRGLEELSRLSRSALAQMRTLRRQLPEALTGVSFGILLHHLTRAMASRTGIPITVQVVSDGSLPPNVQIGLYHLTQEVLSDAARLGAHGIAVQLRCTPGRSGLLRISESGCEFGPYACPSGHLRFANLQERARSIGAELELKSQPAVGTEISMTWPTTGANVSDAGHPAHSRHDCG